MKKFCLSALLAAVLMLPGFAQAETMGVYVAPKFVLNMQSTELEALGASSGTLDDTSAGGALAVGYDFSRKYDVPVRAELEFGAYGRLSESESASVNGLSIGAEAEVGITTLLANVYWDIADYSGFTPYVGAGLGMAWVKTELSASIAGLGSASIDDTKAVFAGQLGFGCSYEFNDNIALDLGYRCLFVGDGEVEYAGLKVESKDNIAHQIMLGVRFTF